MKNKITYSEDKKIAEYLGHKFYLRKDGYYRCKQKGEAYRKLLHVFVYETETETNKPDGYDIHHKDIDKSNNEFWNLSCLIIPEHVRLHNQFKLEKCATAMKKANIELGYPGLKALRKVQKLNNYPSLKRANEKKKKPILRINPDGSLDKKFNSLSAAAKEMGKFPAHISGCANGKRKTAFGYQWEWDYEKVNAL